MKQGMSWKFLVGTLRPVISMEDGQDFRTQETLITKITKTVSS
jgi:hypothetical protein